MIRIRTVFRSHSALNKNAIPSDTDTQRSWGRKVRELAAHGYSLQLMGVPFVVEKDDGSFQSGNAWLSEVSA